MKPPQHRSNLNAAADLEAASDKWNLNWDTNSKLSVALTFVDSLPPGDRQRFMDYCKDRAREEGAQVEDQPARYTPGPWVKDDGFVRPQDMVEQLLENTTWVAVGICDEDGYAASVAYCHPDNASLISAAPEMLEALTHALEQVEWHTDGMSEEAFKDSAWRPLWTELRAAIAKATHQTTT